MGRGGARASAALPILQSSTPYLGAASQITEPRFPTPQATNPPRSHARGQESLIAQTGGALVRVRPRSDGAQTARRKQGAFSLARWDAEPGDVSELEA
jgi:hypothetical protein